MSWLEKLKVASQDMAYKAIPNMLTPVSPGKGIDDRPKKTNLPARRVSASNEGTSIYGSVVNDAKFSFPKCLPEVIPIIRRLMICNPDVGQVMYNIVSLGNTGHKIFFDRKVSVEQQDAMRNHLMNRRKNWSTGQAGINGLVNKMFYQTLISGALSNEWVPNKDLTGIESCVLVNPEEIFFFQNDRQTGYHPYQRARNVALDTKYKSDKMGYIRLNPETYKYYALNGDLDVPYGIPPYISVLPRIDTQDNMNKNIDYVVEEWGLLGLLEVLIQKPDLDEQIDTTPEIYEGRLETLLTQAKERLATGVNDGVVVGYKEDAEFRWNSIGKEYEHAIKLFRNNELQTFSALKHDPSLAGRDYNTSETQIGVVFIKMLSELRNIQNNIKTNLEFGYSLELMLAGYKFDYLNVTFNRSTLQDDLKYQQGQEIKIRNVKDKLIMGVINQEQAADELDYETSAFPLPQVPWEILAGGSIPNTNDNAAAGADKKKKKTANDKKTRQKNKPVAKPNK